jgi:MFS family permease
MSYTNFLPVFAEDVFGDGEGNATGLGLMMTMIGFGALIGSLFVAATQGYPKKTQLQLLSGIGFGAGLAFFAIQESFYVALLALALLGFCSTCFMTLNNALLMSASDSRYYGRVMSLNIMAFALMPLGTLPVGVLADAIHRFDAGPLTLHGIQVTQLGAGLLLVGFILLVAVLNRGYGQLRQSDLKRFARIAAERS